MTTTPVSSVALVILDGWGLAGPGPGNAISLAETPTFDSLPLTAEVKKALTEMGYVHPTPVQIACYDPVVRGQDVIVRQGQYGKGACPLRPAPLPCSRVGHHHIYVGQFADAVVAGGGVFGIERHDRRAESQCGQIARIGRRAAGGEQADPPDAARA